MASLPAEQTAAPAFIAVNAATRNFADMPRSALYNPATPILHTRGLRPAPRQNQRLRRAQILGTIRRLLTELGVEGVTVRGVAQASGHAVQTIYNLVGPRDYAIVEAISEYTRFVGYTALADHEDPNAVESIVDCWLRSIETSPEFCRQVCLIYFTPSRAIFYHFRDKQSKATHAMLAKQQRGGILRPDVNLAELAEQLVTFASATCVEWSDRPFPLDQLHRRMCAGFGNLLDGARLSGAAIRPRGFAI